jgi:HAMP domain-containing protein
MSSERFAELSETSEPGGLLARLWASTSLSSVKGRIVTGIGLATVLLIGVVASAAWQARVHQSDLSHLENHSYTASLLQTAEANSAIAGLLLQRYVIAGEESYVAEIQDHADAAQVNLNEVLTLETVAGIDDVYAAGTLLIQDVARTIQLRQTGNIAEAEAQVEEIVPVFREYRLTLEARATEELEAVAVLREQANSTGRLVILLLVVSGAIGGTLLVVGGFLLARSIIKPLSALEDTARRASAGDLSARAPPTHRRPEPGRHGSPHWPGEPPRLPQADARAGRSRAPVRLQSGPDHPGHRRLQRSQRHAWSPGRR